LVSAGIGLIGAVIVVSLYFFFHTKDFEEEYSKQNDQIISVLRQEFKVALDAMDQDRKSASSETDLNILYPHITKLSEKAGEIQEWQRHIVDGKKHLRSFARDIFSGFFFVGLMLIMVAFIEELESGSELLGGFFLAYVAGLFLMHAYTHLKEYCDIAKQIDEKHAEISKQ